MARGKKRKPDLRKIRTTRVYQLQDIANELNRSVRTVRSWVKAGLPVLEGPGTALVDGAVLKNWLYEQSLSKKQKCLANELYCFKCRKPRSVRQGSLSFHPRNAKTMTIKALCGSCGTRMNRAAASADLAQIQARFQPPTPHTAHLVGCDDPSVNRHILLPYTDQSDLASKTGPSRSNIASKMPVKFH